MLTTHKEAAHKWCPQTSSRCQSDQCMAWRSAHDHKGFCGLAGKPSQVVMTEAVAGARMLQDMLNGGAA